MTDDPPIAKEELYQLHQIRVGKEPTRAQRSDMYKNPANTGIKLRSEEEYENNPKVRQSHHVLKSKVR